MLTQLTRRLEKILPISSSKPSVSDDQVNHDLCTLAHTHSIMCTLGPTLTLLSQMRKRTRRKGRWDQQGKGAEEGGEKGAEEGKEKTAQKGEEKGQRREGRKVQRREGRKVQRREERKVQRREERRVWKREGRIKHTQLGSQKSLQHYRKSSNFQQPARKTQQNQHHEPCICQNVTGETFIKLMELKRKEKEAEEELKRCRKEERE